MFPPSKSISARALTVNALAPTPAALTNLSYCDDTRHLARAFSLLAASSRDYAKPLHIYIGDGAASLRFFLAAAASIPGTDVTVEGSRQLMSRPSMPLVDTLRSLGADISLSDNAFHVRGKRLTGGIAEVDTTLSSQFVSALMLAAPQWEKGLEIRFNTRPVSYPYITMTARVMERFGVRVRLSEKGVEVPPGGYSAPERYAVESDWSAASYLYELLSLSPGREVRTTDLCAPGKSVQGDAACATLFSCLGVTTEFHDDGSALIRSGGPRKDYISVDMTDTPDLVPAFAAACCGTGTRFEIRGIGHLRHKECDRLTALVSELGKCGFVLTTHTDSLSWDGKRTPLTEKKITIDSHGDHRIAMSLAPLGLIIPCGLKTDHPEVVNKSYPAYWDMLRTFTR